MAKDRISLSGEDSTLWEAVARTATPLRARPIFAAKADAAPRAAGAAEPQSTARPKQRSGPPGPIDRRTARRIARGAIKLDARLDLHGHTQADAHRRLYEFLSAVREDGGRLVLVITGKGAVGEGGGVLRRMLPGWLASPRFRPQVAGFEEARRAHGGAGAFYIRLRRR